MHGQHSALTVMHVPRSLDSGLRTLCKVARRADEDRLPLLAARALAADKALIEI